MMMRYLCYVLVILVIWMAMPIVAQDDERQQQCFDKGGLLDEETGMCQLHAALEINADYPLEYANIPFVAERLDQAVNSEIQSFMMMFVEGGMAPSVAGWGMDMTYWEIRHNDHIFTVVFHEYLYTGGAHGISAKFTHTFDTETETELTLDDVFIDVDAGLAMVAPLAVDYIETRTDGEADDDWVANGTDPTIPENYAVWALLPDSILFYFGDYQVSSYAEGAEVIEVLFSDIADVLEPAFVLEN